jgi:hypothetical protein
MLFALQYQAVLEQESRDVEKKTRRISKIFVPDFSFFKLFFAKTVARKIHPFLLTQSLKTKGLLAEIEKNSAELANRDLSVAIQPFEQIIQLNIKLKEVIARVPATVKARIPECASWDPILEETIDNLYSILRILKRHHRITPIETSSLARESANTSLHSLETIIHGRRAT